jgi:hypothetical protein
MGQRSRAMSRAWAAPERFAGCAAAKICVTTEQPYCRGSWDKSCASRRGSSQAHSIGKCSLRRRFWIELPELGGVPGHVDADWDFIFDRHSKERGRRDFEVGERRGYGAGDVMIRAFYCLMKGHVGVVRGVAGKLDFEVAIQRWRGERGLRQSEAHRDDGKLCTSRGLNHVQVSVTISGVKGLDRHRDQEIAFTCVADSFAARSVTDTVDLMNGVRHVVVKGRLVEHPGLVG